MPTNAQPNSKRQLKEQKLLETAAKICQRIGNRFPDSGLFGVAGEVETVTREALARAEAIGRPIWWLRAGLGLLVVIAIVTIIASAPTRDEQVSFWKSVLEFLDATKIGTAVVIATLFSLFKLETYFKRRRALKAIHELRAMAHIIDMHQLTKAPDQIGDPSGGPNVAGRPMSVEDMVRYLHYCTELLAIISKIGQLYVQDFSDAQVLSAVDRFEELAASLSNKMWQKLMILDRIRSGGDKDAGQVAAQQAKGQ